MHTRHFFLDDHQVNPDVRKPFFLFPDGNEQRLPDDLFELVCAGNIIKIVIPDATAKILITRKFTESRGKQQMKMLHGQQVKTVEHVDGVLGSLIEKAPKGTHFIITADHGECFGEDGYFGHGPIVHPKVLEVPFLEGIKT